MGDWIEDFVNESDTNEGKCHKCGNGGFIVIQEAREIAGATYDTKEECWDVIEFEPEGGEPEITIKCKKCGEKA